MHLPDDVWGTLSAIFTSQTKSKPFVLFFRSTVRRLYSSSETLLLAASSNIICGNESLDKCKWKWRVYLIEVQEETPFAVPVATGFIFENNQSFSADLSISLGWEQWKVQLTGCRFLPPDRESYVYGGRSKPSPLLRLCLVNNLSVFRGFRISSWFEPIHELRT